MCSCDLRIGLFGIDDLWCRHHCVTDVLHDVGSLCDRHFQDPVPRIGASSHKGNCCCTGLQGPRIKRHPCHLKWCYLRYQALYCYYCRTIGCDITFGARKQIPGLDFHFYSAEISIQRIASWVLYPLAWLIGIPFQDLMPSAEAMGIKFIISEFAAFASFTKIQDTPQPRTRLLTTYAMASSLISGVLARRSRYS